MRPGPRELLAQHAVWEELERRGATIAVIPFAGRGGHGGTVGAITLGRQTGDELVDVRPPMMGEELALALEAPVWDRYGKFAGHPQIRGTVTWTLADRSVRIAGKRGGEAFEDSLA